MADQESQVSTGTKVAFTIGSLIFAVAYFTALDYALMNMQGLDFFYLLRK